MKRLIIFPIIAVLITGMVSAQAIKDQSAPRPQERKEQLRDIPPPPRNSRAGEVNSVTVDGVLKLEKGFVAVESSDSVYVVPKLNRYIGFIAGLREGAKVSVEGYEFNKMIRPTKVTIEGKSYDFMSKDNRQAPEFGKREIRPNDRGAPTPYGKDRRNERRNGRGGCCRS